jgi:hypothetical protein
MSHEFRENPDSRSSDSSGAANRYTAPRTQVPMHAQPIGIWRYRNQLILHESLSLPPRCFRTNELCDESQRKSYTVNSHIAKRILGGFAGAVALFGSLLVFEVIASRWANRQTGYLCCGFALFLGTALIVARREQQASFCYYLCSRSRQRRRTISLFGATMLLLGFALVLMSLMNNDSGIVRGFQAKILLMGIIVSVVGLLVWINANLVVMVQKQGPYFILRGGGRKFLDSFPEASEFRSQEGPESKSP